VMSFLISGQLVEGVGDVVAGMMVVMMMLARGAEAGVVRVTAARWEEGG
jgi:hypothetical protein